MKTKTKTTRRPKCLYSVGKLCAILQASPREVVAAAEAVGVAPEEYRDDTRYYRDEDVSAIREHLQTRATK